MTRRKIVLIFILMILLVLILSPWASAPSPDPASRPASSASPSPVPGASGQPNATEERIRLTAAVAMDEAEYANFQQLVEEQARLLPELEVELTRLEPEKANAAYWDASKLGEAPDVMLMENERVMALAVSGYLAPADKAYSGDSMSEPFEALTASLKWNGYFWGVPFDFDPYVLIWNMDALGSVRGNEAPAPGKLDDWAELAALSREAEPRASWLAIDGEDPIAVLAWLQAATGMRTDNLWSGENDPWTSTPLGEAISLLDREKSGILFSSDPREAGLQLAEGRVIAAVLPHSEADKLAKHPAGAELAVDRSAWSLPYIWPRGRSFVISSRTDDADAASRWIAAMTRDALQLVNLNASGKLPANRSLYPGGGASSDLFPGEPASSFPFQPPADTRPGLSARLDGLKALWTDFAEGRVGAEEWKLRWTELSADAQLYD